jgi:choloylglycine hydrolase
LRLGAPGQHVVAKSYDWDSGLGMVVANKRGVAKQALVLGPDRPARWTSRYASLTFNQYGRELPNGGMNEAGLVVEIMWLASSRYPDRDARPTLNELQWIQHALDRYASVAELAAAAPTVRVAPVYAAVHYLACDAAGACAAFEYLDGRLVITANEALRAPALTNTPYAAAATTLARYAGFGGSAAPPPGTSSLARFVRAADAARRGPGRTDPVTAAFAVLDDVAQGDYSKWQIVYEPRAQRVHFRSLGHRAVKTVRLDHFAPGCEAPVKLLDLGTDAGGDASARFADYTPAANRALVTASLAKLGGGVPAVLGELLARYPDTLSCALAP